MKSKYFRHDPQLARLIFLYYTAMTGRVASDNAYTRWLHRYVRPLLRLLVEKGEIEDVSGLGV